MKRITTFALPIVPLFLVLACSSTGSNTGFVDGGPDDGGLNDGTVLPPGEGGFAFDSAFDSPFTGCASANYKAKQTPAALLVVLDASGTMRDNNKYSFAQQALIAAIDQDAFDSASLGLLLYPTGTVDGPACLAGGLFPVDCKVSALAQVPLASAGAEKSNAQTGVRHSIYTQLVASEPKMGAGDGNPSFEALTVAINSLKAYNVSGKRIVVYITDGGASCASVTTRPGYMDSNMCPDWEQPNSIVTLLKTAHDDATKPVNTFIVGVPGADTTGADPTQEPPYHVRNALSAYAFAGSPETTDSTCTGKAYTQTGPDPTVSCHFDMTQPGTYSVAKLGDALNSIRGKVLGCVFELPVPEAGVIDKGKVNVVSTVGGMESALFKRKDASNPCTTDGCWDYTADNKVELFGKACDAVKTSTNANVQIVVGCETQVK